MEFLCLSSCSCQNVPVVPFWKFSGAKVGGVRVGKEWRKGWYLYPWLPEWFSDPVFFWEHPFSPKEKLFPHEKKTKRSRFQHVSKTIILNEYCHNPPTNHQPTGLVSPAHNGTTVGLVPAPPALGVWGHPAGCGSSQPSLSPRFTQKNHRWYIIMVNNG
jgi:hypothetical protein